MPTLRTRDRASLPDRAFAAAYAAEPTNAQILWDRALLLQQHADRGRFEGLLHLEEVAQPVVH